MKWVQEMEDSKKGDKASSRKIKPRSLFLQSGSAGGEDSDGAKALKQKNAKLWDEVLDGHVGFGGFEGAGRYISSLLDFSNPILFQI